MIEKVLSFSIDRDGVEIVKMSPTDLDTKLGRSFMLSARRFHAGY